MADYQYLNSTGVIVPDTADILTGVENEFREGFGNDLVTTPDTPQGVLITSETLARDAVVRNNAALANQLNPNIAGGVFLDAICALTALQRIAATRSVALVQLTGVPSTIIPAGSQARTSVGDIFESTGTVILDGSGNGEVSFRSVEYGPVPAAASAINMIVTAVLGWETVTNADGAILGTEEQSDESLRALRRNTLALQGVALPVAITSALYATEGVRSLTFRENIAATTQVIDTITMVAHSIYVCVDGGTDLDVATAILNNKSLGAGYNGGTTVPVVEPASGQTYDVTFDRPTAIPIKARVTIKSGTYLVDPVTAIVNSILAYANGDLSSEPGFTVGSDISTFELSGAINRAYPEIFVKKVEITTIAADSYSTALIPIEIDEIATITSGTIFVVIE